MLKITNNVKTIIISFLIAAIVSLSIMPDNKTNEVNSVFDNVMTSGKLKCGYVISPPALMKDANTGELSGISYDLVNEMGKNLDLQVEWTEEVSWATMLEGLSNHRYDALCSAIWSTTPRAKRADFLDPIYYGGVGIWVKAGDNRFDNINNLEELNNKDIKIATMDGHISQITTKSDYPKATRVSLPDFSNISELFNLVTSKKADLVFEENYIAWDFMKNNPNLVKNIVPNNPIRVFPTTILIPQNEPSLKQMLNTAQNELLNIGRMEKLLKKYQVPDGSLILGKRAF